MSVFLKHNSLYLKLITTLILLFLAACSDSTSNDANIRISITGQNIEANSNKARSDTSYKSNIPAGVTRIDITITDSNDSVTKGSIAVSSSTETINLRVAPHVSLNVLMQAFSGDVLSFEGSTPVNALRPGESYPVSVTLDDVLAPSDDVVLYFTQPQFSVVEADNNIQTLSFLVTLSSLANGNVTFDYATSSLTAAAGDDYIESTGSLSIPAGQTSQQISIGVVGDTQPEPDETFTLTLSNLSANVSLGLPSSAIGIIISDDYPRRLNDTGVVRCGDYAFNSSLLNHNNNLDCDLTGSDATTDGVDSDGDPVPAGQDAHFGRDKALYNGDNRLSGFSFTKLDAKGQPLTNQNQDYATQPWPCVQDNYTGLIWEVKTTAGLQSTTSTYSWYNSTGINDAGFPGPESGGICTSSTRCDTEKYVSDINTLSSGTGICGSNQWRLPTTSELMSIVNNGLFNPAIDINYFPNTQFPDNEVGYWSSNPQPNKTLATAAMGVSYFAGRSTYYSRLSFSQFVRLVTTPRINLP